MKRILLAVSAASLGLAVLAIPSSATATRTSVVRGGAPECGSIRLVNPDGTRVWLALCGGGPNEEQALHNWANGTTVNVDGAYVRGVDCGSRSQPCIGFSITSPAS